VYATGPALSGDGVYRPEALDADGSPDAFVRWLRLADRTLRALGFEPEVALSTDDAAFADAARDALGSLTVTDGERARAEFATEGPTGVVEERDGRVRCAPVGSARRALGALADDLPAALAPTQLRFVPIDGTGERCRSLAEDLAVRADVDDRDRPAAERLNGADSEGVPFLAVLGPEDAAVSLADPERREERCPAGELDARVREELEWGWPPVPARRPVLLSRR
jgi:hypothetical protein